MYSAFINPDHISPLAATIPAMFAKSSMVFSTVLFFYSNKPIRENFIHSNWSANDDDDIEKNNGLELNGIYI